MITLNLKWFVGLSVAAHAAVLVGWQSPLVIPGNTGQSVQLSVVQQAGDRPVQTATTATGKQPLQQQAATDVSERADKANNTDIQVMDRHAAPVFHEVPAPVQQVITEPVVTNSTPATVASSPLAQPHEVDRYLRDSVMKLITRELSYPAIARRKGWQGVVRLELHIEADGSITGLQLDETSGYAVLDRAALQCLQTANIPEARQWLRGRSADIIVPVEYRLVDG